MAQGLNIPAVSSQLRGFFQSFLADAKGNGKTTSTTDQVSTSSETSSSQAEEGDILDLGSSSLLTPASTSGNGIQISPDGTYQFSRTKLSASLDYSSTEAVLQTSQTANGSNVFASLTNLNVSFSVSAEYEEALIQTGRSQGSDPVSSFGFAARQAVERVKAQQISAAMNFSLSFSQSSISFSDSFDLQGDLEALSEEGILGGYAVLLQTFFGDDEKFSDFIHNLKEFMSGITGSSSSSGGVDALTQAVADNSDFVSIENQSLTVSVNMSFESTSIQVSSTNTAAAASDPIVFDLDGDGIELTSVADGVKFDLNADGSVETAATVTGGDGLLALDKNNNGIIDDGTELFGDQNGASNGFAELAKYDSNGDGSIDSKDAVFDQLRVLVRGTNEDSSSLGQLLTLTQAGISSISLGADDVSESAAGGNKIAQRSYFTRTDGTTGESADALLNRLV